VFRKSPAAETGRSSPTAAKPGGCARPAAPAISSPVIGADASERGDLGLNKAPFHRTVASAGFQDHGSLRGARLTGAVEMQLPPADIDQATGRRKRRGARGLSRGRHGHQQNGGQIACHLPQHTVLLLILFCSILTAVCQFPSPAGARRLATLRRQGGTVSRCLYPHHTALRTG